MDESRLSHHHPLAIQFNGIKFKTRVLLTSHKAISSNAAHAINHRRDSSSTHLHAVVNAYAEHDTSDQVRTFRFQASESGLRGHIIP